MSGLRLLASCRWRKSLSEFLNFTFENLESWLHELPAIALQTRLRKSAKYVFAIVTHERALLVLKNALPFHPFRSLNEVAHTVRQRVSNVYWGVFHLMKHLIHRLSWHRFVKVVQLVKVLVVEKSSFALYTAELFIDCWLFYFGEQSIDLLLGSIRRFLEMNLIRLGLRIVIKLV